MQSILVISFFKMILILAFHYGSVRFVTHLAKNAQLAVGSFDRENGHVNTFAHGKIAQLVIELGRIVAFKRAKP